MKIEFSDNELRALVRVLTFVRFECKDYDAGFLAGSPHVADIFKRITEATSEYYKSNNIPFPNEWPAIESMDNYLDVIRIRIKDANNWIQLNPNQRDSFLKILLYPYKYSEKTFNELIQFGDEFHSPKPNS
ncbi:MAG: hypothetical protein RH948_08890 [Cyclobacteriaceae bacterium]